MNNKTKSIEFICNKLLDNKDITQTEYDVIMNKYSNKEGISLVIKEQAGKTDSKLLNEIMIEIGVDLSTLFNNIKDIDNSIDKFYRLNRSIINSMILKSDKNNDEIHLIKNKLRDKTTYSYYETFRDSSYIANDFEYKYMNAYFDKYLEGLRLNYNSSISAILSKSGNRTGKIEILKQFASMFTTYKNEYTSLESAIDNSMETYWHECIEVDEPIEVDYNSFVSNIKHGAVCELLITIPAIMDINEISLKPFAEYPLEVLEISYSTNDEDKFEDFIPIAFNIKSELLNKYLVNKSSNKFIMFQFETINVKRIKIVLNQIHYGINHFISKEENLLINGIFIKKDNEELINRLLKPVNDAIFLTDLNVGNKIDNKISNLNKLQYEYGLYNIGILNNEYYSTSEFISNHYGFPGLSTIALKTIEEHYELGLIDPFSTTSIEYEIIVNDDKSYPILPSNKSMVEFELLIPYQDVENNIYANTRFDMNTLDITNNIKIYRDDKLMEYGYSILNNNTIEFTEYDPYSKYSVTYRLNNLKAAKELKIPTFSEMIQLVNVRVRAILRQNSRTYTEVTPILYEYELYATNVPIPIGEYNDLISLTIIPEKSFTNVPYKIPVVKSDKPVLLSIDIMQDPIIVDVVEIPNTNKLQVVDVVEVDEYIE